MGLRIRSQIICILFVPMAMVIIVMCYFNITLLESTLLAALSDNTSAAAHYITSHIENIIPVDSRNNDRLLIKAEEAQSVTGFLKSTQDMRDFRIYDRKGVTLFKYQNYDDELVQKEPFLRKALDSGAIISHLWAYRSASGTNGEPVSRPAFLENRSLSYDYYIPVAYNGFSGIFYISFFAGKLPTLLKLITIGNIMLVVIFLVSIYIAISIWSDNAIRRPLSFILQAHDRLAKGDFDTRVNLDFTHTNELARAYGSFNNMAEDLKSFREELEKKNIRLGELNERYKQLNERLEIEVQDKTKELREFFSLITHDLKVPLAASQGYTQLLLKPRTGPLNDKQQKFLQGISMANTYLLVLVRNMLDSVKYEAGKINYFFEPFDLSVLLAEIKSNLHLFLEEKQIELHTAIDSGSHFVYADRMKIGQVLTNLISNAITVSENRGIITFCAYDRGDSIEMQVSDQGPGISHEKQASIFDKFTQFHGSSKSTGGMGLGLYIVKKILEGHSQAILVKSDPGEGCTFIFKLPKSGNSNEMQEEPPLSSAN